MAQAENDGILRRKVGEKPSLSARNSDLRGLAVMRGLRFSGLYKIPHKIPGLFLLFAGGSHGVDERPRGILRVIDQDVLACADTVRALPSRNQLGEARQPRWSGRIAEDALA